MVPRFHLVHVVCVSIFKLRAGISGLCLTNCLLFSPSLLSLLVRSSEFSHHFIPAAIAENLSMQLKLFPFVYWKLSSYSKSSSSQAESPSMC